MKSRPSLQLFLLGSFRAVVDGEPVPSERWPRRKCLLLLKRLALSPGFELHRDQAMESLWPGTSRDTAATNLNKIVLFTRRALEPGLRRGADSRFLDRPSDRIRLCDESLFVDALAFDEAAARALSGDDPEACAAALSLYSGDLLVEDRYEDWAIARRDRLRLRHRELLRRAAALAVARGEDGAAVEALGELLEHEPADEAAHRGLMEIWLRAGQRDRAARQYEACRDALRRLVDAEPEAATRELFAKVRARGQHDEIRVRRDAPGIRPGTRPESGGPGDGELESGGDRSEERRSEERRSEERRSEERRSEERRSEERRSEERRSEELRSGGRPTLAVLPLRNESEDAGLDYLVDGITESLIHNLSQLPSLRVLARSTVFRAKASGDDPLAVARELDASAVVVGRVLRVGDRLRVGVELVRASDGSVEWGERFDRPWTDIFEVEEEISRDISRKLRIELTTKDESRLGRRHTRSMEAYDEYLRGRFQWNKRTGEALRRAIGHFEQALEHDPTYALAYSGLADGFNLLGLYGVESPRSVMPRAKAAAERALEIDPELAEAHTSLAYARFYYDWDGPAAEAGFREALDRKPGYATAHHWYHELLTARGRFDDARREIREAESLDPLSTIIKADVGWGLYFAREYAAAEGHLRDAVAMDGAFGVARLVLGLVRFELGAADDGLAQIEAAIERYPGPFPLAVGARGFVLARSGRRDDARRAIDELASLPKRGHVASHAEAMVRTGLGDAPGALARLAEAVDQRYDRVVYLGVDPVFDALRGRSEFDGLLARVRLG